MPEISGFVHCPALGRAVTVGYCRLTQLAANDEVSYGNRTDVITLQKAMLCASCPKRKDLSKS